MRGARRSRTRLLVAAVVAAVTNTAHSGAPAAVPLDVSRQARDASSRLDAISLPAAGTSLSDRLREAAGLIGLSARAAGVEPVPAPSNVPSALAEPVARMVAAVNRAERDVRASILGSTRELQSAMQTLSPSALGARDVRLDGTSRSQPSSGRSFLDYSALIDHGRMLSAALTLTRAVDAAMPELIAAGPAFTSSAAGCDVAEVPGVLCIGGTGRNEHETDFPLLVDLGGDDVHRNSAGGACTLCGALAVSVAIDLDGDDQYVRRDAPGTTVFAQGAGGFGAVGILVDAAGDDSYRALSGEACPSLGAGCEKRAQVAAQGMGVLGVGILADGSGNDTYHALASSEDHSDPAAGLSAHPQAIGQGAGLLGVGVLVDGDTGTDSYLVETRPVTYIDDQGWLRPGGANSAGIGYGAVNGVGFFADGGGTDSMTVRSKSGLVDASDPARSSYGFAEAFGPAYGLGGLGGGAGVALSGVGPTTWTAESEASAPVDTGEGARFRGFRGSLRTWALGFSQLGGFGALEDAGGDDVYVARSATRAVRRKTIDDDCACAGGEVRAATALRAEVLAMAAATAGGASILRDLSGSDRYTITAASTADVEVRDERTTSPADPAEPELAAIATAGEVSAGGQGLALLGAYGLLLDGAGDDVYEATATAATSARATARPAGSRVRSESVPGQVVSAGQALGLLGAYGELRDLGGYDQYSARATNTAVAEPPDPAQVEGVVFPTHAQASALALGASHLLDVDGGDRDAFFTSPAVPTCAGERGGAMWTDCGTTLDPGLGVGLVLVS